MSYLKKSMKKQKVCGVRFISGSQTQIRSGSPGEDLKVLLFRQQLIPNESMRGGSQAGADLKTGLLSLPFHRGGN